MGSDTHHLSLSQDIHRRRARLYFGGAIGAPSTTTIRAKGEKGTSGFRCAMKTFQGPKTDVQNSCAGHNTSRNNLSSLVNYAILQIGSLILQIGAEAAGGEEDDVQCPRIPGVTYWMAAL